MAFIGRLGNIPIYGGGFLIGNPGNALISDNSYGFTWQMLGETEEDQFNTFKKYAAQLPGTAGSSVIKFPLHKDATLTDPEIDTDFEIVVTAEGQYYSNTSTVPNLITGVGSVPWNRTAFTPGWPDGRHTYILGIPVYSDAMQTNLTGIVFPEREIDSSGNSVGTSRMDTISLSFFKNKGFDVDIVDYDPDFGPGSEPDGYGQNTTPAFDHTSDTITIPDPPSVSTSSVGFMHVYNVASGALATLGQYLFPSVANITDIESALRAIAGIFAYRDSVQYIVDLHAIPVAPTTGGSAAIKIGSLTTEISQPVVPTDYVDFDCGSVSIPEQYCNFIDFIGTRCKLFLPFVGFVEIAPEYWNGGTLSVKYRFNVIDGSFMAYVRATSSKSKLANSLIGQYGGSACLHLPVIANSYGALASGLVGGSMQIAAGAATGNVGGVVAGALTASNFQGNMSQSNNYNASTSFLGGRRPYLLIEREVPNFSTQYTHDKGLPCNVAVSLSRVSGFTIIDDIDLSGITGATENEIAELRQLLKEGVYF